MVVPVFALPTLPTTSSLLRFLPPAKLMLYSLPPRFIQTSRFFEAFGSRIVHIHVSDNRYRYDDHMPLGAGEINWKEILATIKATGYDESFTLEVFCREREYQLLSRDKFLRWWNAT